MILRAYQLTRYALFFKHLSKVVHREPKSIENTATWRVNNRFESCHPDTANPLIYRVFRGFRTILRVDFDNVFTRFITPSYRGTCPNLSKGVLFIGHNNRVNNAECITFFIIYCMTVSSINHIGSCPTAKIRNCHNVYFFRN